jgi:hypothetical protein
LILRITVTPLEFIQIAQNGYVNRIRSLGNQPLENSNRIVHLTLRCPQQSQRSDGVRVVGKHFERVSVKPHGCLKFTGGPCNFTKLPVTPRNSLRRWRRPGTSLGQCVQVFLAGCDCLSSQYRQVCQPRFSGNRARIELLHFLISGRRFVVVTKFHQRVAEQLKPKAASWLILCQFLCMIARQHKVVRLVFSLG